MSTASVNMSFMFSEYVLPKFCSWVDDADILASHTTARLADIHTNDREHRVIRLATHAALSPRYRKCSATTVVLVHRNDTDTMITNRL